MATFNKFNSFLEAMVNEKHNFETDVLQIALCAPASTPIAGDAVLTDLTQIAYTNLSTQVITTTSSGLNGTTYELILTDLVLTASGNVAEFQFVVIFNQTAASDELIGWYDYGSGVTMTNGETFTCNFASPTITIA